MKNTSQKKCCCCENSLWDINRYELLDVCKVCGLAQSKVMPSESELRDYYDKDYYFGEEYIDYTKDRRALEINFKKRVDLILKLSRKKKLNVCEVGSAYGYFLNLIKPFSHKVRGFEMSDEGVDYSNSNFQVNTTTKDFLKTEVSKDQDVVVMWDVIEHLLEPDRYVKKAADLLNKDGLLCVTTGDISSLVAQRQGNRWRMIHPPTHLYYFTKKSLEILFEKNGLEPVYSSYPAHYRNLGSVLGMMILDAERKNRSSSVIKIVASVADRTGLANFNFGVNTRDIILIVGRKK